MCLDFQKLSYDICLPFRSDPYPSFTLKRANETTSVTNLNTSIPIPPRTDSPTPQNHALSSGAYIGIGILVAAFILGLLALAFFFYSRRNTRESVHAGDEDSVPEMSGNEINEIDTPNEAKELYVWERKLSMDPVELDASQYHELDGVKR
jgi:hypothetical protein